MFSDGRLAASGYFAVFSATIACLLAPDADFAADTPASAPLYTLPPPRFSPQR